MIKFGAQEIILANSEKEEEMKENIEQLIDYSLKRTEELEKTLLAKAIEDKFNLNNVSLTD
jgi:hypothetical protein